MARNNQPIPTGNYGNVIVMNKNMISPEHMKMLILNADQVLAGTNKTCKKINDQTKEYLDMDLHKLNVGEKIICLVNNWDVELDENGDYSLVNGIIGNVTSTKGIVSDGNIGKLSFKPDFIDNETKGLLYDKTIFEKGEFQYQFHQKAYLMDDGSYQIKKEFLGRQNNETELEYRNRLKEYAIQKRDAIYSEEINFFQDAYCISVHKSQGSEWDNVLLFDESNIFEDSNRWLYTAITRAKKKLVIIK